MLRMRGRLFVAVAILPLHPDFACAVDRYEVIVEHDVPTKMRDGVVLRADIYHPKSDGQFPVILQRCCRLFTLDDPQQRGSPHRDGRYVDAGKQTRPVFAA
jgi:predicted acyl esterase